jgi:hypothetical protein
MLVGEDAMRGGLRSIQGGQFGRRSAAEHYGHFAPVP